jgi:hypothetical protein
LLHNAANLVGAVLRPLPAGWRFSTARLVAWLLLPAFKRTALCREQLAMGLNEPREVTLAFLLRFLTRTRLVFPVPIRSHGNFNLNNALKSDRGVLFIGLHAVIGYVAFRHVYDRGADPLVVEATPHPLVGLGGKFARPIVANGLWLRAVRRHLAAGEVVVAWPDRAEATKRTRALNLPARPVNVATPLFDLARETGSRVVLYTARVDRRFNIEAFWQQAKNESLDGVFAEMEAFFGRELPSSHALRHGEVAP